MVKPNTKLFSYNEPFLMFAMDKMAYEYEQKYNDVIRLTLGKSELPPPPNVIAAMDSALQNQKLSSLVFPKGLPQLIDKITQWYNQRYNKNIAADQIIISAGTSTLFRNLYNLLLNQETELLLPKPYYPMYRYCALLTGCKIKYYNINLKTLRIDFKSLNDNLTDKTQIVVINSPGNPLGNILSLNDLKQIDEIVQARALILSDEIYANMSFQENAHSFIEIDSDSDFVITNGFSKGYRMYARRVGYGIVPIWMVEPLTIIQHHTLLTTDPVCQFGAISALENQNAIAEIRDLYRERCNYTICKLQAISHVEVLSSQGSFYITLDCREFINKFQFHNSYDLASDIMQETHVATVPTQDFGLDSCLRLSFSSSQYHEAIDRMFSYFSSFH